MKNVYALISLAVFSIYGLQAHGQANPIHPQLTNTHTFLLGGFQQDVDAAFYADADNQNIPSAKIDLGDLGMDETDFSWLAEYRYRMSDKWLFSVGGYKFDTSGSLEANKTFNYDGVEFEAGVDIESELSTSTFIFDAMYKVYDSDRANVFVGGGVHFTDVETELKGRINIGDVAGSGKRAGDTLLAPLPNLRAHGIYAFSPKWSVSGSVGWLSMNIDDYEGSFSYLSARLSYLLTDHLGLGLGYQYLDMDFSVQRKNGEAGVDIQFNGPSAYISYSF
jgi:opacity protein-like surface antigen